MLGVDPGSAVTGYGVIERRDTGLRCVDCGTIAGGAGELPDRLMTVYEGLHAVLQAYRPAAVAIENAFLGRNVRALAVMSQARGVLVLAARKADLPVFEYTPREIKLSVVGTGRASKSQVAYMVAALLQMANGGLPRDATDSLAVALCHLHRNGG
ncbi:MAG TPA: crossover junction endodeoxyribonuclease RuvC [Gemmatimonadota bacterium]|nr:crossover junction endodeoxyribonuclease RuvC [Gemmatimonadota bacterium]